MFAVAEMWRWVPIGRVLERRRDLLNPADEPDRQYQTLGLEDIAGDGVGESSVQTQDGSSLESTKAAFSKGELLYGRLRPYLNKAAIATCDGVCSTEIWVFRATPQIDLQYAFLCVVSPLVLDRVSRITQGANLPRVEAEAFDRLEIPLPPLSEQRRIVAVLEEARTVRRLRRQADDLTGELIPATFHEMFGKYVAGQAECRWEVLGSVAEIQGGLQVSGRRDALPLKKPYLRVANVHRGRLDLSEIKDIGLTTAELNRARLLLNDVLLVEGHGNIEELGRAALWDGSIEDCVHQNHIIRVRCRERVYPAYVCNLVNSVAGRHYFQVAGNTTSGLNTISTGVVAALRVPIPPESLQREFERIVTSVSTLHGAPVDYELLGRLDASLLAHAFSGELTADWRAANREMLEREAAERDAALAAAGVKLAKPTRAVITTDLPTTGRYAELNREQRELLRQARTALQTNGNGSAFTIQSMRDWLESPLTGLCDDALRRHLEVLVARGLIKLVSRMSGELPASTSEMRQDRGGFANVYRLAREERMSDEAESDLARMEELIRIVRMGREHYVSVTQQVHVSDAVDGQAEGGGS